MGSRARQMNLLVALMRCFDGYSQLTSANRRVNFTVVPNRDANCPIKLNQLVNYYANQGNFQGNQRQSFTDQPQTINILMNGTDGSQFIQVLAEAGDHEEWLQQIVYHGPNYGTIALIAVGSCAGAVVLALSLCILIYYCRKIKSTNDMRHFVEDQMEKSLLLDDMEYVVVDECDDLGNSKKRPGQLVDLRA